MKEYIRREYYSDNEFLLDYSTMKDKYISSIIPDISLENRVIVEYRRRD